MDVVSVMNPNIENKYHENFEKTALLANSCETRQSIRLVGGLDPLPRTGELDESDFSETRQPSSNMKFSGSNEQLGLHCHTELEDGLVDKRARRQLIKASTLCLIFMLAEIVGGYIANSLAIATDAAHLLSDFASFLISLFALFLASRPATKRMNFGWYRAEVIGALISVLMIWLVTIVLVYMAIQRVLYPDYEINAAIMMITAAFGVVFNISMLGVLHEHGHGHSHGGQQRSSPGKSKAKTETAKRNSSSANYGSLSNGATKVRNTRVYENGDNIDLLSRSNDAESGGSVEISDGEHSGNINVRAAFIHVVGDLVQSFGVLLASYIIYYHPELKIADPICTFIFSVLVLFTTIKIMRDVMRVLMEGTPSDISFNEVKEMLCSIKGVKEAHNLHIWSLTTSKAALSVHLALDKDAKGPEIVAIADQLLRQKFQICESTIQVENYVDEMNDCAKCKDPKD